MLSEGERIINYSGLKLIEHYDVIMQNNWERGHSVRYTSLPPRKISKQLSEYTKQIQLNLGFRTSRSSNNSVFKRKIRDENHSVLEQKFGSQTTQES